MSNEKTEPTGDRRSVHTDALATLGTIIDASQKRDAIHLAVEPVVAGHALHPGDRITVKDGVATRAYRETALGIVDPFLEGYVEKGERFWFVMMPRMVHSLRHVWTHPAFPNVDGTADATPALEGKAAAEAWIKDYADRIDVGWRDLVEAAGYWIDCGDYMCRGGILEGVSTSPEFWDHYETYTGRKVPEGKRGSFFTCSC